MEKFPLHILYHLSMYSSDEELLQKARKLPANQWSGKYRSSLNVYRVGQMLPVEREVAGILWINRKQHINMLDKQCLLRL